MSRLALAAALAVALAVAGCGGGQRTDRHHRGGPEAAPAVDIYASFPLRGSAQARSLLQGASLALRQAGGTAGLYRVRLITRDSARPTGHDQPPAAAADARDAATDQRAVLFLGGFTDSAAELSVPILNLASIAEVAVGSTYVGLTQAMAPVTAPNEPDVYYPTSSRTLLRLLPAEPVEAAGDLLALQQERCARVALAHDSSLYGTAMATLIEREKGALGVDVVSDTALGSALGTLRAYASTLRQEGVECLEYAGQSIPAAVEVARTIHLALPIPILVPGRLCSSRLTDPGAGGVPEAVGAVLSCTRPTLPVAPRGYPGSFGFAAAYRAAYHGSTPDAPAILGYEAMKLGLDTISRLGNQGNDREAVVRALRDMPLRRSVLGLYRFDRNGDTTLRTIGLYRVRAPSHQLGFDRVLSVPRLP